MRVQHHHGNQSLHHIEGVAQFNRPLHTGTAQGCRLLRVAHLGQDDNIPALAHQKGIHRVEDAVRGWGNWDSPASFRVFVGGQEMALHGLVDT